MTNITLRDYFAVHASDHDIKVQAEIIRSKTNDGKLPDGWQNIARYMHADTMLEARKYGTQGSFMVKLVEWKSDGIVTYKVTQKGIS